MREIYYTLLGEGKAETYLLPPLIEHLALDHGIKLVNRTFNNLPPTRPRGYVKANINRFFQNSKQKSMECGLFVAGIDADTHVAIQVKTILSELEASIKGLDHTVVLYLPVQAIDAWLLYLINKKYKPGTIDKLDRTKVKEEVYHSARPKDSQVKEQCDVVVNLLKMPHEAQHLIDSSISFRDFYSRLINSLKRL